MGLNNILQLYVKNKRFIIIGTISVFAIYKIGYYCGGLLFKFL